MKPGIEVLGVGHNTPVCMELAIDCGYEIKALWHYNGERTGQTDHGYNIRGSFDQLFDGDLRGRSFLLTMGDINIRKSLIDRILWGGGKLPALIHPRAVVSHAAMIDQCGVLVFVFAEVGANARVEANAMILQQSLIERDARIGQYAFISQKSFIGASSTVGESAFIGQGAIVERGIDVGAGAYVGAMAVVDKPVAANSLVVGDPAEFLRKI